MNLPSSARRLRTRPAGRRKPSLSALVQLTLGLSIPMLCGNYYSDAMLCYRSNESCNEGNDLYCDVAAKLLIAQSASITYRYRTLLSAFLAHHLT